MAEIELHPDFKDFLRLLNSHEDLKRNKRETGRHKDLEDLEHLP
jgi:hypothetical protein